jgi:hypothetical protein
MSTQIVDVGPGVIERTCSTPRRRAGIACLRGTVDAATMTECGGDLEPSQRCRRGQRRAWQTISEPNWSPYRALS